MTTCLLLAAGSSSRMKDIQLTTELVTCGGIPKMLLPFKGTTLLQHITGEIEKADAGGLLVVTGCYHHLLAPVLAAHQIAFTENRHWEEGMGSSVRWGVNHIVNNYPNAHSIIILVCDQPYISSSLINELITTAKQSGKGIIASAYSNTLGTPVLFDKKYFKELQSLSGQAGAKKILQQYPGDVAAVPFSAGATDIDSPEDYQALR